MQRVTAAPAQGGTGLSLEPEQSLKFVGAQRPIMSLAL
jgi:hypothetical protein